MEASGVGIVASSLPNNSSHVKICSAYSVRYKRGKTENQENIENVIQERSDFLQYTVRSLNI